MPAKRMKLDPRTKNAVGRVVTQKLQSFEEKKELVGNASKSLSNNFDVANCITFLEDGSGNGIAQGVTSNSRLGNRIRVEEIELCIYVYPFPNDANNKNGMSCRFMIVKDKEWKNDATITPANYVHDIDRYYTIPNWNRRNRYKIMKEWQHNMVVTAGTVGTAEATGAPRLYTFRFKPNSVIEYTNTGGDNAGILNTNFLLLAAADAGGCCAYSARWRTVFTEAAS